LSKNDISHWISENIYDYFTLPLHDDSYRTFVLIGGSLVSPGQFNECRASITESIKRLEKDFDI